MAVRPVQRARRGARAWARSLGHRRARHVPALRCARQMAAPGPGVQGRCASPDQEAGGRLALHRGAGDWPRGRPLVVSWCRTSARSWGKTERPRWRPSADTRPLGAGRPGGHALCWARQVGASGSMLGMKPNTEQLAEDADPVGAAEEQPSSNLRWGGGQRQFGRCFSAINGVIRSVVDEGWGETNKDSIPS